MSAQLQVKVSAGPSGAAGCQTGAGLGRACYSSPLAQPLLMASPAFSIPSSSVAVEAGWE